MVDPIKSFGKVTISHIHDMRKLRNSPRLLETVSLLIMKKANGIIVDDRILSLVHSFSLLIYLINSLTKLRSSVCVDYIKIINILTSATALTKPYRLKRKRKQRAD